VSSGGDIARVRHVTTCRSSNKDHVQALASTLKVVFHDFPGEFNPVVSEQVRFSYTFTKCDYRI